MTEHDPALAPFDALVGTWTTEATHPQFDAVVPGSAPAPPSVTVEVTSTPVLSYALAHNRVPVVSRLALTNLGEAVRGCWDGRGHRSHSTREVAGRVMPGIGVPHPSQPPQPSGGLTDAPARNR